MKFSVGEEKRRRKAGEFRERSSKMPRPPKTASFMSVARGWLLYILTASRTTVIPAPSSVPVQTFPFLSPQSVQCPPSSSQPLPLLMVLGLGGKRKDGKGEGGRENSLLQPLHWGKWARPDLTVPFLVFALRSLPSPFSFIFRCHGFIL